MAQRGTCTPACDLVARCRRRLTNQPADGQLALADQLALALGAPPKWRLPRKEVIQAHLPVHLPCYDFVPVAGPTLASSLPKVGSPSSSVTDSHDVTGGVYKARERIHRSKADLRLLATPPSWSRVADSNPNCDQVWRISSASRLRDPLS
jgi:hypothetical protein